MRISHLTLWPHDSGLGFSLPLPLSQMWEEAIALGKELAEQYENEMFDYEQLSELLVGPSFCIEEPRRPLLFLAFPFPFPLGALPWPWPASCLCPEDGLGDPPADPGPRAAPAHGLRSFGAGLRLPGGTGTRAAGALTPSPWGPCARAGAEQPRAAPATEAAHSSLLPAPCPSHVTRLMALWHLSLFESGNLSFYILLQCVSVSDQHRSLKP